MILTYAVDRRNILPEVASLKAQGAKIPTRENGDLIFNGETSVFRNGIQSVAIADASPEMIALVELSTSIEILADSADPVGDVLADPMSDAYAKLVGVLGAPVEFVTTSSIIDYRAEQARIAEAA